MCLQCSRTLGLPVPSLLFACLTYLWNYADYVGGDFLEFGWPVGFDYSSCLSLDSPQVCNHKGSATDFPDAADTYLS